MKSYFNFFKKDPESADEKPCQLYGSGSDSPISQISKEPFRVKNNDEQGAEINHCYVSRKWEAKEHAGIQNADEDDPFYLQCGSLACEDLMEQMVGPNGHANNIQKMEADEESFFQEVCSNEEAALRDLERAYADYEAISASWF